MARSDADRARDYRQRRRDARDAERARETAAAATRAGTATRDAVESSIAAAAKWLAPSDAGTLAQLRAVARIVDVAIAAGDVDLELAAHGRLLRLLTSAGLTPTARLRQELRSARAEPIGPDAELPKNVAPISASPRPPQRRG